MTDKNNSVYRLLGPFNQLVSMAGLPLKGSLSDDLNTPIENAGIIIAGKTIYAAGTFESLKKQARELDAVEIPLNDSYVCLPGFIDAHTHICFAGSREKDYAMRNAGKTYLEIAEAGGGIWDTVQETRKASPTELTQSTIKRINRHLSEGVTTIEIKSGYGLSVAEELKTLGAIKAAAEKSEAGIIATCLAAHMLPRDFNGSHSAYLQQIINELLPVLKRENLCDRVDAFIEKGAFTSEDIRIYFEQAKQMGFKLTVHADQFNTGGSALAVEMNALSADHLEASTATEIALLANSNTVAVALPGASMGLGCAFAPARKLLNAGACVAIASDWNPGSAPMGNLLMQASVLGAFEKLSNTEVLAGITCRAAKALDLKDRGTIAPGMLADFSLFPVRHYREILYYQGTIKPAQVWKNGNCVCKND